MTPGAAALLVILGPLALLLPRRWAAVPLLVAACYTARTPVVQLGPANLSVLRLLILVAFVRLLVRGERLAHGVRALDCLVAMWALVLVGTSAFHTSDAWTVRLGAVLSDVGAYVMFRAFLIEPADVRRLFYAVSLLVVPLAILMLLEKHDAHNYFSVFGQLEGTNIRGGHVRAYGPFAHPLLAGTVAATCAVMAFYVVRTSRIVGMIGLAASAAIIYATTSSGPVMMTVSACLGLGFWLLRPALPLVRWGFVAAVIALQAVMNDPVYFLMARIDLTGSSTGWYRSQLIRSSIEHLSEWWLVGTDYTRHWMPTGIHANEQHADITNQFLAMGVVGGLPLMLMLILMLYAGFRAVGRGVRGPWRPGSEGAFLAWTLGAMLFAHTINFWSISLFDQASLFFFLLLAAVVGVGYTPEAEARALLAQRRRTRRRRAAERTAADDDSPASMPAPAAIMAPTTGRLQGAWR